MVMSELKQGLEWTCRIDTYVGQPSTSTEPRDTLPPIPCDG